MQKITDTKIFKISGIIGYILFFLHLSITNICNTGFTLIFLILPMLCLSILIPISYLIIFIIIISKGNNNIKQNNIFLRILLVIGHIFYIIASIKSLIWLLNFTRA